MKNTRSGSALILAIGAAIPLLIAGGVLLTAVTRARTAADHSIVVQQARDVSASGAQNAMARLVADPNFTGDYDLELSGPVAHIAVAAWANDGVDNDKNGKVDDDGEADYLSVTSVGAVNEVLDAKGNALDLPTRQGRSTTEVVLKKNKVDIVTNQAVYIDDPLATFKFAGTAFLISGNDTNINNTVGPNSPIAGIGTPGDPNWIKNQLSAKQKPLVIGKSGSPSVLNVEDVDFSNQIHSIAQLASVVWTDATTSYGGDIGDRADLVPVIAHAKGNLKLNGDTKGCGILVVDGDLTVNGSFDFVGFIYAGGAVTFNGGGGAKDLHGALYTLGAVSGTDVTLNGTVQLQYSSQALQVVTTQLAASVSLVSWTQR
jgi:hypothetical protein